MFVKSIGNTTGSEITALDELSSSSTTVTNSRANGDTHEKFG